MLNLAEYTAAAAELRSLGQQAESNTLDNVQNLSKPAAVQVGLGQAAEYQQQWIKLLYSTMMEVAQNLVEHYNEQLGLDLDVQSTAEQLVEQQFTNRYYGSNLNQRLVFNYNGLQRRVSLSGNVDPKHLGTVYSQTPLFGSQTSIDQRVLLGTVAKIENDAARTIGQETKHKLVRWTLSHRHSQPDVCDELASNIDRKVVQYLEANNLNEDPKGLYFAEDLPDPPHPNCQCEFGISKGDEIVKPRPLQRAVQKVRKILRRLRRR